ncbi:MAG TPA: UBP-type zinc finger domain-containing protein [Candidatus Limnocylindria bacterium]|nr:UBP-type zinc finger domain-containing protein [Candidatus Limnocylindria bacterium]
MDGLCAHLSAPAAADPTPGGDGCGECLAIGSGWVHLRLCLTCGNVGCCDSSPNRHASRHARAKRHPVIRSFEPDERWRYCFADDSWSEE